jgi:putative phosphoesterase
MGLFAERGVGAVIHAGDLVAPFTAKRLKAGPGPLHVIYGNNDGERAGLKAVLPQIQEGPLWVALGGIRILVHHFFDWCEARCLEQADVVITGHSHEVVNESREGRLLLNPGESCGWVTGRSTVAILDTDGPKAEVCELELP